MSDYGCKKRGYRLLLFFVSLLILYFSVPTNNVLALSPAVNRTDLKNTYNNLSQDMFLITHPKQADITYTTNISSDRLKVYKKNKDTHVLGLKGLGPLYFVDKKNSHVGAVIGDDGQIHNYKNEQYSSYISGYSSVAFDIKNPQQSDQIVTYHKRAGKYRDSWFDAQVTYSNFTYKYNPTFKKIVENNGGNVEDLGILENHVYLDINENLTNGYVYLNAESFKINIKFINSDTKTPILVDSYDSADEKRHSFLTFNSLNYGRRNPPTTEFVRYDDLIDQNQVFVTKDTNVEYGHPYQTLVGDDFFYGANDDFTDELGTQNFTRNSVSFELRGGDANLGYTFTVGATDAVAWNAFSGAPLFKSILPPDMQPKKSVTSISGNDIQGKRLDVKSPVDWNVSVPIGRMGVDLLEKYEKLQVTDTLPNDVDYLSYQVFDSANNDVTNMTTVIKNGQSLSINFNQNYLASGVKYEGEVYRVIIHTKIKDTAANNAKIENTANVTYDKMNLRTNSAFVYAQHITPPEKFVREDGATTLQTKNVLSSLDDTINYEVFYTVNDEVSDYYYKQYQMKDVLPSGLDVLSAKIFNSKSEDVTSNFTNKSSGNIVVFQANSNILNTSAFYNNVYTLKITARPKSYDQIKHLVVNNKVTFSNKAYLSINDEPALESKTVTTDVYVNGKTPTGQVVHYDQSIDRTGTSSASIIKSEDIKFQEHKVWVSNLQQVIFRTVRYDSATNAYVYENTTEMRDLGHYVRTYSYSISPRTDLVKTTASGVYKYVPMVDHVFTQSNISPYNLDKIQIKIPYLVPRAEAYANKLVVDTDDASSGLPFSLFLVKNMLQFKSANSDFSNVKMNVKIANLNTGKVYWEITKPFYQLASTYTGRLNVGNFSNGAKIPLKVLITTVENPDKREILLDSNVFSSAGYIKSHKHILGNLSQSQYNVNADNSAEVVYPIRTEKVRGLEMHTYHEKLQVSANSLMLTKTGYGVLPKIKVNYHNDLNQTYDLRVGLKFPKSFITSADRLDVIAMRDAYQFAMDTSNQLPRMYVKKGNGAIYNLKYVDNLTNFIDGGFKLYIPIWHDLGRYPLSYTFQSGDVGKNAMTLDLQSAVDIYANMYLGSKSKTVTHDELFVKPIVE